MPPVFLMFWVLCFIIAFGGLIWFHINEYKTLTALGMIGYVLLSAIPVINWFIAGFATLFFLSQVKVIDRTQKHRE